MATPASTVGRLCAPSYIPLVNKTYVKVLALEVFQLALLWWLQQAFL
jgi:hypothetical protein